MRQEDLSELMEMLRRSTESLSGDEEGKLKALKELLFQYVGSFVEFANIILGYDKRYNVDIGRDIISAVLVGIFLNTYDSIDDALAKIDGLHDSMRQRIIDIDKMLNKDV